MAATNFIISKKLICQYSLWLIKINGRDKSVGSVLDLFTPIASLDCRQVWYSEVTQCRKVMTQVVIVGADLLVQRLHSSSCNAALQSN